MRAKRLLALIVSGIALVPFASAAESEAAKAKDITRILSSNEFKPSRPGDAFCTRLLTSLTTFSEISLAEPIARADNYDAAEMKPFRSRCGAQPLNESFQCDPQATRDIKWDRDPKKRREQALESCEVWHGTKNFKVFDLPLGRPKSESKLVVYYEAVYGPANSSKEKTFTDGGYHVLETKSCAPASGVGTHDPYSYFQKSERRAVNGIVRYKNDYYVVDLYELEGAKRDQKPEYRLQVSPLERTAGHGCAYSTLSSEEAIRRNQAMRQKGEKK